MIVSLPHSAAMHARVVLAPPQEASEHLPPHRLDRLARDGAEGVPDLRPRSKPRTLFGGRLGGLYPGRASSIGKLDSRSIAEAPNKLGCRGPLGWRGAARTLTAATPRASRLSPISRTSSRVTCTEQRDIHRVGPEFASWLNVLVKNPD